MINKKYKESILVIAYACLFIVNRLFILIAAISFYLMIAAAGDGKFNDGNIKVVMTSLASGMICAVIARFLSIAMDNMAKTYRKKQAVKIKKRY